MKIITREQFDNLKQGDVLKGNNESQITVDAKFTNTIIGINAELHAISYSFAELVRYNYSLKLEL
jgi:hypothetical protein